MLPLRARCCELGVSCGPNLALVEPAFGLRRDAEADDELEICAGGASDEYGGGAVRMGGSVYCDVPIGGSCGENCNCRCRIRDVSCGRVVVA